MRSSTFMQEIENVVNQKNPASPGLEPMYLAGIISVSVCILLGIVLVIYWYNRPQPGQSSKHRMRRMTTYSILGSLVLGSGIFGLIATTNGDARKFHDQMQTHNQAVEQQMISKESAVRRLLSEALVDDDLQSVELAVLWGDQKVLKVVTKLYKDSAGNPTSDEVQMVSTWLFLDENPSSVATMWAKDLIRNKRPVALVTYDNGRQEILEATLSSSGKPSLVKPLIDIEVTEIKR